MAFNVGLNNHQKDSTHFQNPNILQPDAKFIFVEQIAKIYNTVKELRFILKKQEKFWTLNLSRLFKSRTKQCMIKFFAVINCATLSINTSTIDSWRPQ